MCTAHKSPAKTQRAHSSKLPHHQQPFPTFHQAVSLGWKCHPAWHFHHKMWNKFWPRWRTRIFFILYFWTVGSCGTLRSGWEGTGLDNCGDCRDNSDGGDSGRVSSRLRLYTPDMCPGKMVTVPLSSKTSTLMAASSSYTLDKSVMSKVA